MIHFDRQIVVGIVLDVSKQHDSDGNRYIDIVKTGLIDFATKLGLNCGVYVAHPNKHQMPRQQGESVAGIFSYNEPIGFKASEALAQAMEMLAAQEADEKYVVLITDRYLPVHPFQFKKSLEANNDRKYGCSFLFLGVGERYDRKALKEFAEDHCQVHHLDTPAQVGAKISETIIIGV